MEGFAAQKLNEFETGKISRRKLIETLTFAATAAAGTGAAAAQGAPSPLKAELINHISYTCPDFKKAGDWYAKVFNMNLVAETKRDVIAVFGKQGDQPYNVTAKDVPLSHLVIRTRPTQPAAPQPNARPKPPVQGVIDHVSYTVADFNRAQAKAALIAMGVKNVREGGPFGLHFDDAFGYDVEVSGLENNALTDG
jgi:catechol 2,3-dioxygenase-like lactoylglutathione lyase family enzyme